MANNYLVFCHIVPIKEESKVAVRGLVSQFEDFARDAFNACFVSELTGNKETDIPLVQEAFLKNILHEEMDSSVYQAAESLFNMDSEFAEWLLTFVDPDNGGCMDFDADLYDNGLYLSAEESGNIVNAAHLLRFLIKAGFTVNDHEVVDYCWYCSKLRPGQFGGSAVLVTAEYVRFMPSSDEWAMYELKGY